MVRPKKEINWDIVDKMIEAGCTAKEIMGKFRICRDTFCRRFKEEYETTFSDYHTEFDTVGEGDIRLMQHMKALNNDAPGNVQMLIWLGKIRLGQKEPENVSFIPPKQDEIYKDNLIMMLQHKIRQLESNANQSEAGSELL